MDDVSQAWEQTSLISILLPVCDPELDWLESAVHSVQTQTYGNWQLCIVDDQSEKAEIRNFLSQLASADERIVVKSLSTRSGISLATNSALEMAAGAFVVLLDHDDELTPDALYELATVIRTEDVDVIYSDEDKITLDGQLETPTYKPDFAPYWLLSCNYMVHLVCYRTELLRSIGGFRTEFDGSQDYDVALRISRKTDRIRHIPKVLYHWRIVPGSAANPAKREKPWAYEAARRALEDHVEELGLVGSLRPSEADGYYRLSPNLAMPWTVSIIISNQAQERLLRHSSIDPRIEIVVAEPSESDRPTDIRSLNETATRASGDVLIFLGDVKPPGQAQWPFEVAYWAMLPDVAVVGGALRGRYGRVEQIGLVIDKRMGIRSEMCACYRDELGPLGVNFAVHEVSAIGSFCFAVSRQKFELLKGFDASFLDPFHAVDFCLRAEELGLVSLCNPQVVFRSTQARRSSTPLAPSGAFLNRWANRLALGDHYYSPHYSETGLLYGLRCYDDPSEWEAAHRGTTE